MHLLQLLIFCQEALLSLSNQSQTQNIISPFFLQAPSLCPILPEPYPYVQVVRPVPVPRPAVPVPVPKAHVVQAPRGLGCRECTEVTWFRGFGVWGFRGLRVWGFRGLGVWGFRGLGVKGFRVTGNARGCRRIS